MKVANEDQPTRRPLLGWLAAVFAGSVAPAGALLIAGDALAVGPIVAVGMMGAGMIAAAVAGSFRIGGLCALTNGVGLLLLGRAQGLHGFDAPVLACLALFIASLSFAARGALFARSAAARGWWIALAVVGGEAAVVLTALADPSALPGWLLALLPAQWANIAIQAALTGTGAPVAIAALLALGGTAAATLLVAWLWPRRWPYLVMFTTWLSLSALVWQRLETAV